MTTKDKLLGLFEENKGIYFSGEEIAKKLCVSRAAVWKAVKSLRDEGYVIDAVTNKGYCLSVNTDILSIQGIQKYLNEEYPDIFHPERLLNTGHTDSSAVPHKPSVHRLW